MKTRVVEWGKRNRRGHDLRRKSSGAAEQIVDR